jgi:GntR family transcriptional regulator/MocR family aminotransferase
MSHDVKARTFRPELPAIDQFPVAQWTKMMTRMVNGLAADPQRFLLAECDAQGCLPLREALANQFSRVRGIRCSAENIIIFAGAQQARSIVLQALLRPGDRAIVEDPCHPRAVETLRSVGARVIGVAVDDDGLDVARALEVSPQARMAYISPRTQFPLGHRLSNVRRQMLEDWAHASSAWIVEDDYSDDSSILQQDQPLPLDSDRNRTILLGAFNKILFPSLRFAFAVVPNSILPHLVEARRLAGGYAPLAEQLVLEEFIRDGHLDRYIRRSSKLASQRLAFMTGMMKRHLDGLVEPAVTGSSTHIIGWLTSHEEQPVVEEGSALGLELVPLSRFTRVHRLQPGLLLGYGGFQEYDIEVGIGKLRRAIERA